MLFSHPRNKSAKECIKALAEHFDFKEVKDAEDRGRWAVTLLERVVRRLAERLGGVIIDSWIVGMGRTTYMYGGFHEGKLDTEAVKIRMPAMKCLIETTKKTLASQEHK
ncbi:MAG: Archaeal PaREP1/PaREP8 family protein [Candidatus Bathyarchaeota archaeon BA2]|nr:MAG: Archaeal PaREP1/PaREP8 family protein [Candidatus Bathyarchaeota archaeon BA2]